MVLHLTHAHVRHCNHTTITIHYVWEQERDMEGGREGRRGGKGEREGERETKLMLGEIYFIEHHC